MKSKVILATSLAVILFAGATVLVSKNTANSLFLDNVEALADATPVQTCYLIGQGSNFEYKIFCNKDTTPDMIYSCETTPSYHSASGTSLCTK